MRLRSGRPTLRSAPGLATDADARVLGGDGKPIPGLYACGNDMASVMAGSYPGPGTTLGPAIVFAYRAVMHAKVGTNASLRSTDVSVNIII